MQDIVIKNTCIYHQKENINYICLQPGCTNQQKLLCQKCKYEKNNQTHPHYQHTSYRIKEFLLKNNNFRVQQIQSITNSKDKKEIERQLYEQLDYVKITFEKWIQNYANHIKFCLQGMSKMEVDYIEVYIAKSYFFLFQLLTALDQKFSSIFTKDEIFLSRDDCQFLVQFEQGSIKNTILNLRKTQMKIFQQLFDPLEDLQKCMKDILLAQRQTIIPRRFSKVGALDEQVAYLLKKKQQKSENEVENQSHREIQKKIDEEVNQLANIQNESTSLMQSPALQAQPSKDSSSMKKLPELNDSHQKEQKHTGVQKKANNLLSLPKQDVPLDMPNQDQQKVSKLKRKRQELEEKMKIHTQKHLIQQNCMRSGYEYLEKMQLNEDEDGKDWMYTSSDMIRETDCTEGIEMNDKMNEICEELFDYKYRDNEKLDIVEGWFICMK